MAVLEEDEEEVEYLLAALNDLAGMQEALLPAILGTPMVCAQSTPEVRAAPPMNVSMHSFGSDKDVTPTRPDTVKRSSQALAASIATPAAAPGLRPKSKPQPQQQRHQTDCSHVDAHENAAQPAQNRNQGKLPTHDPLAIHGSSETDFPSQDYAHQMADKYGNKYFENLEEELPLRTRWVDYKDKEFDPSQIEPGWHAWMSYMVDKSPAVDPLLQRQVRVWEPKEHRPTLTWSRSGYKPYSTYVFTTSPITQQMDSNHSHSTKNKYSAWTPVAKARA
ncbi:NDUFA12-domain-containing protein [Stemphylium lycopersici]|nr:NDUFA12-domain-containing protein [Stemphylium lycopersici]